MSFTIDLVSVTILLEKCIRNYNLSHSGRSEILNGKQYNGFKFHAIYLYNVISRAYTRLRLSETSLH